MIPPHSCAVPGRKPGTSTNVTSGMLNASQVRTKRAALTDESMSSTPASDARLVADDADGMPAEPREAADDVLGVALVHLEVVAVVDDELDHALDVVRLGRIVRDERVELGLLPVGRVGREPRTAPARGCSAAGTRAGSARPRGTASSLGEMKCATPDFDACVAAPPSSSNVTSSPGHRLHHVGAGDEHVRRVLDHEHEVGHGRRVDGAAGARPHHERDLRDDARRLDVAPEDLRVARQRDDALLDPRAARVVDPDHADSRT